MSETILTAIISAGLAALVNCIFQLINKVLDNNKEKMGFKRVREEEYKKKKEQAYLGAIKRLLDIRVGFDFTYQSIISNNKKKEEIDELNTKYMETAALIRLYATDEIYNVYYNLAQFAKYSYSDGIRLAEESKRKYNEQVAILSRRMQDDLGYRKYSENSIQIQCPSCALVHDAFSKCSNCGMTYVELVEKIRKSLIYMEEMQNENNNNQNEVIKK